MPSPPASARLRLTPPDAVARRARSSPLPRQSRRDLFFFSFSPFTGHRTSAVTSVARFSYPSVPSRSRHVRRDNEAKEERATDGRRRATFPFPFLLSNPVIHAAAVQDRMDGVKFLRATREGGKRKRERTLHGAVGTLRSEAAGYGPSVCLLARTAGSGGSAGSSLRHGDCTSDCDLR